MNVDTQKTLSVRHITEDDLKNPILSEALNEAKFLYGDNILCVLVDPLPGKEELVFRPEMGKFMGDTSVQIMKIADLNSIDDTFDCHNTIAMGKTRSQREPGKRAFYNVVIGNILAINPHKESLEKFLVQEEANIQ